MLAWQWYAFISRRSLPQSLLNVVAVISFPARSLSSHGGRPSTHRPPSRLSQGYNSNALLVKREAATVFLRLDNL